MDKFLKSYFPNLTPRELENLNRTLTTEGTVHYLYTHTTHTNMQILPENWKEGAFWEWSICEAVTITLNSKPEKDLVIQKKKSIGQFY